MKLRNEIFASVLDWLVENKGVDGQKGLSHITGISQNTISRIMTGKVEPSDDTLRRLNNAFDNIFNMQYLRGQSTIMLVEDVAYYEQHLGEHPFADVEKSLKQKSASPALAEPAVSTPDMSSVFNATIAAQMQTIEALKAEKSTLIDTHAREMKIKDDLIQSFRDQIAAKDALIAEQKSRLIEYRRIIDSRNTLSDYPFPIGAADAPKQNKKRA